MNDSINGLPSELQNFAIPETTRERNDELGQAEFLELMLTQLQNQDPTSPLDTSDFSSQLAQFATVNGITELQSSFNTLSNQLQSNQALQASTLVGRSVLIEGNTTQLTEGQSVKGGVNVDSSISNLTINIFDAAGQQVNQLNLGTQAPGVVNFEWDGTDINGNQLANGEYSFEAIAQESGNSFSLSTLVGAKVESVTLPSGGSEPLLNLGSSGLVSINQITEVR